MTSAFVQAQPTPAPTSGDAPCEEWPREAVEPDLSHPDAEGFHSLFNGVDFSGWWLNCRSSHTSGADTGGPIFRVDPDRKAIYSTQRGLAGGVLMTRAKFMDYELAFDYWPDWGNEAALQHRTDTNGRAFNTTLGYMPNTSLGGAWGEAGLVGLDHRPFSFGADDTTISIPGGSSGESNWTQITRKLKAAGETVPCPETGCTQEDWRRLWDFDNWNQIRVIFRGGKDPNDPIHARCWFRKPGDTEWVPLSADTNLVMEIKPGYLGLMVHGEGRYGGPRGTWYRNIRWKPWTKPLPTAVHGAPVPASQRTAIRMDNAQQGIRLTFAEGVPRRDLHVFALNGKSMARLPDIRGEAFLSTAGWQRGVYLLRVDAGGRHDWVQFLSP
jgi:hypothetical protein